MYHPGGDHEAKRWLAAVEIVKGTTGKGSAKQLKQGQTVENFVSLSALAVSVSRISSISGDAGLSGSLGYRPPASETACQ